jgi:hypothetical protein
MTQYAPPYALRVEQLGAVADDAAEFLAGSGQKARHIFEGEQGNIEGVAEADEAGSLDRGVDIETPGQKRRLVGDNADRAAVHAGEADHHIARPVLVHLEEFAVVHHPADHLLNIVGQAGIGGNDLVEGGIHAADGIVAGPARRILAVVPRQEA